MANFGCFTQVIPAVVGFRDMRYKIFPPGGWLPCFRYLIKSRLINSTCVCVCVCVCGGGVTPDTHTFLGKPRKCPRTPLTPIAPGHPRAAFPIHLGLLPELRGVITIGIAVGNDLRGAGQVDDEMVKHAGGRTWPSRGRPESEPIEDRARIVPAVQRDRGGISDA